MGKVVTWNGKARFMYVQSHTAKGNLQSWRNKIGQAEDPECRKCGRYAETGKHVALACTLGEQVGMRWEAMDERVRRARKAKDEKRFYTVDLVERFFSNALIFLACICLFVGKAGRGGRTSMNKEGPEGAWGGGIWLVWLAQFGMRGMDRSDSRVRAPGPVADKVAPEPSPGSPRRQAGK